MEWKDILIILISVLTGYLINLTTPFLKSYIDKGTLSLRNRSIEVIKEEYELYKIYSKRHATLSVEILRRLIKGLFFAAIGFVIITPSLFVKLSGRTDWITENISVVIGLFVGGFASFLTDITRMIDTIANFEKYRELAIKR